MASIDIKIFKSDLKGGVSSSDLCTTAAQTVPDDTAWHEYTFEINSSNLSPGDTLDIELTMSGIVPANKDVGPLQILQDIKG